MNIYETIAAVMADIPAIGKERLNKNQNFKYRGVEDVMNVLQPLLVKHKLFVVPSVISQEREERKSGSGGNLIYSILHVEFTFYAEDGSSVTARCVGEGMDSGDKASNKAMAVAFKYACFQVFCIPTEDMPDPDADSPPPSEPAAKSTPAAKSKPAAAETPKPKPEYLCARCKTPFTGLITPSGERFTAREVFEKSTEANGEPLCAKCLKELANENAD